MPKLWPTTLDNPFNPFTQFDDWYAYDVDKGYNTCSYMARLAITSNDLSDEANTEAINQAAKEIVRFNIYGNYKLVNMD